MAKIKPFKGWLPVPMLPAAQVQASSYMQHLAYLEWYINYLFGQVQLCEVLANKVTTIDNDSTDEQYPSAKAVQTKLNAVANALQLIKTQVDAIPKIEVNKPLQGGEADLTSLEWQDPETAVKTLYAVPQGGGTSQTTGTGMIYDQPNSTQRGTFDYVIDGKLLTVHLKIPAAFTSSSMALELRGLPADIEISGYQYFGYVYNASGDATVTPLNICFTQGTNYPQVSCLNAGSVYATSLSLCDNTTFTVVLE